MAEQDVNAAGMLQTLIESFKSHVNERVSSPFAGAFLISWILVNWKALLIIALSKRSIEDRLDYVSLTYLDHNSVLVKPLLCAFIGVIAYYFAATIFLGLFEFYGYLRRKVEQQFDHIRWVDPSTYIKLKSESRAKIRDLTEIAADNQEKLTKLGEVLKDCEAENQKLSSDLEKNHVNIREYEKSLQDASREISDLDEKRGRYWRMAQISEARFDSVAEDLQKVNQSLHNVAERMLATLGYDQQDIVNIRELKEDFVRQRSLDEFKEEKYSFEMLGAVSELSALATKQEEIIENIVRSRAVDA